MILSGKAILKGDAISLNDDVVKNATYNGYFISPAIYSKLKKLPSLLYVTELNSDALVSIKTREGRKISESYPSFLFNGVVIPKTHDVINWLFDAQLISYPVQWNEFLPEINKLTRYIPKMFQNNLKAVYLVNKFQNHLYQNDDSREVLMFYKTLIQNLKISYNERYQKFNKMVARQSFINVCLEIDTSWNTLDAISLYNLNNYNIFKDDTYISNAELVTFYKNPKAKSKFLNESREKMSAFIKEQEAVQYKIKLEGDSRFLKELNQNVINALELSIFNVKTIPTKNQILMIFIDKDNNKRYFIQPVKFVMYISNGPSIINNDYIVNFDPLVHTPLLIQNLDILRNLKFAITANYKQFMSV